MVGTNIYYRNKRGKEKVAPMDEMPQCCGDCDFYSYRTKHRFFDDLEGFDVSYREIICEANGNVLDCVRREGSFGFDYGETMRLLEEKPLTCPLYRKD